MKKKENTENKVAGPEDPERACTEEKLRMRSAKASMTMNMKNVAFFKNLSS